MPGEAVPAVRLAENGVPYDQEACQDEQEREPNAPYVNAVAPFFSRPSPIGGVGHLRHNGGDHAEYHMEAQGTIEGSTGGAKNQDETHDDLEIKTEGKPAAQVPHHLLVRAFTDDSPDGVSQGGQAQKEHDIAKPGMEIVHGLFFPQTGWIGTETRAHLNGP